MKEFLRKLGQKKAFWISLVIVLQTVVYMVAGMGKAYMHMDEAYSMALANYDKIQIQENEDFYNQWHTAEYYRDYLVVNEGEQGDLAPVYNNQRDDVHPPIFYLLLRLGMELTPEKFTKWTGIILNILAFAVGSTFLYLIVEKLLADEEQRLVKAAVLTLVASITMAALSTVIYIRMYAMLTMWVTIAAYLHLKLTEKKQANWGLLVGIAVVTLLGFLTQYYYLFFIVPVCVVMIVRYVRGKRWKELWSYLGVLATAGVVSLVVWPHSIQHLFFGYRGQGAIGNLLNIGNMMEQVGIFVGILVKYAFNYLLPVILIAMFALMAVGLRRGKRLEVSEREMRSFTTLIWPVIFFFVIAAVMSPFMDLRYIEAICGLAFVLTMVGLYWLVRMFAEEKGRNIVMGAVLVLTTVMPLPMKLEPDVTYSRWAEVVAKVEENHAAPALYLFNGGNNRFLDDILLFTELDESYVMQVENDEGAEMKPEEYYTTKRIGEVLKGKDLAEGLWVFSNYGYGEANRGYLEVIEEVTGLEEVYNFRLNSGEVYLLK